MTLPRRYTVGQPRIYQIDSEVFELEVPRNRVLVSELKQQIPGERRRWSRELGTQGRWVIANEYLGEVITLLEQFYPRGG